MAATINIVIDDPGDPDPRGGGRSGSDIRDVNLVGVETSPGDILDVKIAELAGPLPVTVVDPGGMGGDLMRDWLAAPVIAIPGVVDPLPPRGGLGIPVVDRILGGP